MICIGGNKKGEYRKNKNRKQLICNYLRFRVVVPPGITRGLTLNLLPFACADIVPTFSPATPYLRKLRSSIRIFIVRSFSAKICFRYSTVSLLFGRFFEPATFTGSLSKK